MLNIGIHSIFTFIFTVLLINTFDRFDDNVNIAMTKRDMIGVAIVSLFSSFLISEHFSSSIVNYLIISIMSSLIIMMAYTDLKTMEVYGIINFINLGLAIIYFIYNIENFNLLITNELQLKMILVCIAILLVLFFTQGVGLGDTILYAALMLIYLVSSVYGCLFIILNILISNTLFLILNSFKFIKNKKQKLPLIPYILVSWLLLMVTI